MSALLSVTMPCMRNTIEALKKAGLEGQVKTIINWACATQQYTDEIGADGYGANACAAVRLAKSFMRNNKTATRRV